ncbi:MAG: ChaN family lipoprotein [Terriglobales bacterium]
MATTGTLRSRRSAAQLHAIASVEREIRAIDPAVGRKYIRDFREAYRCYQRVLAPGEVRRAVDNADIVLVGDYHALPNSQRYLASLLGDPELHRRPVVLGVETVFARDQHILDEWNRGEISEQELRQRVRFELDWGYEWAPFFELLSAARDHGALTYGLDCTPREDLRKIGARDRHAADKIVELRRLHPEARIMVLFGESHLAPQHLPALLEERLGAQRTLILLQNVDALYWRAAGEAADRVEAIEVRDNVLCVFNATPLEKYENYRLCLARWGRSDDDHSPPDLGPTIYNLIDGMVRFLGINQYSPHNTTQPKLLVDLMPEVYSRKSDALLRRLLLREGFTDAQRRSLLRRVRERGSAYLAPLNAIYVRHFHMISSAEDATRFLHQACRGLPNLRNARASAQPIAGAATPGGKTLLKDDAFYTAVFEHALAFFGTRILHPARAAVRDADMADLFDVTREDLETQTRLPFAAALEALDFVIERRKAPVRFAQAPPFTGRKYEYVVEQLGSLAGNDLYDAYLEGRLTPAALRKLFLLHIEQPGAARDAYVRLQTRLRSGRRV